MPRTRHRFAALLVVALLAASCGAGAPRPAEVDPAGEPAADATPERVEAVLDGDRYTAPGDAFTLRVPGEWTALQGTDAVWITPPADTDLSLVVWATAAGEDLDQTLDDAWARAGVPRAVEDDRIEVPSPPPGIDAMRVVTYRPDAETIAQVLVQDAGPTRVVAFIHGTIAAAQRRGAELNIAVSSIEIAGVESLALDRVGPWTDALQADLAGFVDEARTTWGAPGIAFAVVELDAEGAPRVWTGAHGNADADAPMTADTRLMIGSTTKPLTTGLTARMVEAGKATWDTPVAEIIPGFSLADPAATAALKLEHLVCACTGVPRRDFELFFTPSTQEDTGALLAELGTFELLTGFGETFHYSNQMVAAAGVAAAALAHPGEDGLTAWHAAMDEEVFGPLGMTSTTSRFDAAIAETHARPHRWRFDGTAVGDIEAMPIDWERFVVPVGPAGSVWSTASDMARFAGVMLMRGQLADGTAWLSPATLDLLWTPGVEISDEVAYGRGWMIDGSDGVRRVSHGGNTLGFTSHFMLYPDHGLALVVLTNMGSANPLHSAVSKRFETLAFGAPDVAAERLAFAVERTVEALNERTLDPVDDAALAGRWAHPTMGELTVAVGDDGAIVTATLWTSPLATNEDGDLILAGGPIPGLPLRLEDGEPARIVFGLGLATLSFERLP